MGPDPLRELNSDALVTAKDEKNQIRLIVFDALENLG